MIGREMVDMLLFDEYRYPHEGSKRKGRPTPVSIEPIEDRYLQSARELVDREVRELQAEKGPINLEEFIAKWEETRKVDTLDSYS